jgi:hypothetical protein
LTLKETEKTPHADVTCDFVCSNCVTKNPFLLQYSHLLLFPSIADNNTKPNDSAIVNTTTTPNLKVSEVNVEESKEESKEEAPSTEICKLKTLPKTSVSLINTFWKPEWREELCHCKDCLDMYGTLKVMYLLDPEEDDVDDEIEETADVTADPEFEITSIMTNALQRANVPHEGKIKFAEKWKEFKDGFVNHLKRAYEENADKKEVTAEVISSYFLLTIFRMSILFLMD